MASDAQEMSAEHVSSRLREAFPGAVVQVEDISDGCGYKYAVVVVTDDFAGKSLIQRHRAVNGALSEEMKIIHALTIKAYTHEQWSQLQSA